MTSTSGETRNHAWFFILQIVIIVSVLLLLGDLSNISNLNYFLHTNLAIIIVSLIFSGLLALLFSYIRSDRVEAILSMIIFISGVVLLKTCIETNIYQVYNTAKSNYMIKFAVARDNGMLNYPGNVTYRSQYGQENANNGNLSYSERNTSNSYNSMVASSNYNIKDSGTTFSDDMTDDVKKMTQDFLPITDEAFDAAEKLMNSGEGTSEYREAQGELIREAAKSTANIVVESGKEAFQAVTSKDFWNGILDKH